MLPTTHFIRYINENYTAAREKRALVKTASKNYQQNPTNTNARELEKALQEKTEKGTPNDKYENFVEAHLEAASKCIPTKPRTKHRAPWETLAVREKRAFVFVGFF